MILPSNITQLPDGSYQFTDDTRYTKLLPDGQGGTVLVRPKMPDFSEFILPEPTPPPPPPEEKSILGKAFRGAAAALPGTVGGLGTLGLAAAAGVPFVGVPGVLAMMALGAAGGLTGQVVAENSDIWNTARERGLFDVEALSFTPEQIAEDQASGGLGGLVSRFSPLLTEALFMRPSVQSTKTLLSPTTWKNVAKQAASKNTAEYLTPLQKATLSEAGLGGAVELGVGAGMRGAMGGDAFDPAELAADFFSGGFMNQPTAVTKTVRDWASKVPGSMMTPEFMESAPESIERIKRENQEFNTQEANKALLRALRVNEDQLNTIQDRIPKDRILEGEEAALLAGLNQPEVPTLEQMEQQRLEAAFKEPKLKPTATEARKAKQEQAAAEVFPAELKALYDTAGPATHVDAKGNPVWQLPATKDRPARTVRVARDNKGKPYWQDIADYVPLSPREAAEVERLAKDPKYTFRMLDGKVAVYREGKLMQGFSFAPDPAGDLVNLTTGTRFQSTQRQPDYARSVERLADQQGFPKEGEPSIAEMDAEEARIKREEQAAIRKEAKAEEQRTIPQGEPNKQEDAATAEIFDADFEKSLEGLSPMQRIAAQAKRSRQQRQARYQEEAADPTLKDMGWKETYQAFNDRMKDDPEAMKVFFEEMDNLADRFGGRIERVDKLADGEGRQFAGRYANLVAEISKSQALWDTMPHELTHMFLDQLEAHGSKKALAALNRAYGLIEASPEFKALKEEIVAKSANPEARAKEFDANEFLSTQIGRDWIRNYGNTAEKFSQELRRIFRVHWQSNPSARDITDFYRSYMKQVVPFNEQRLMKFRGLVQEEEKPTVEEEGKAVEEEPVVEPEVKKPAPPEPYEASEGLLIKGIIKRHLRDGKPFELKGKNLERARRTPGAVLEERDGKTYVVELDGVKLKDGATETSADTLTPAELAAAKASYYKGDGKLKSIDFQKSYRMSDDSVRKGTRILKQTAKELDIIPLTIKGVDHPVYQADSFGRRFLVKEVDGVKVVFYRSTGQAGKTKTKPGNWYPVLGLAETSGWINKGSDEGLALYYGSKKLKAAAKELDQATQAGKLPLFLNYFDKTSSVASSDKSGLIAGGKYADEFSEAINKVYAEIGIKPAEKNTPETRNNIKESVDKLRAKLGEDPSTARYQEIDSEYMRVAEAGDTEAAQRMVDEAAKRAGYWLKAFHQTNGKFNVFDMSRIGTGPGGTNTRWRKPSAFFTIDGVKIRQLLKKLNLPPAYGKTEMAVYLKPDQQKDYIPYANLDAMRNGVDESGKEIAITDPNRIKSADPITYDDAGNIIPLSERFNPASEDIRYQDAESDFATVPDDAKGTLKVTDELATPFSAKKTIWDYSPDADVKNKLLYLADVYNDRIGDNKFWFRGSTTEELISLLNDGTTKSQGINDQTEKGATFFSSSFGKAAGYGLRARNGKRIKNGVVMVFKPSLFDGKAYEASPFEQERFNARLITDPYSSDQLVGAVSLVSGQFFDKNSAKAKLGIDSRYQDIDKDFATLPDIPVETPTSLGTSYDVTSSYEGDPDAQLENTLTLPGVRSALDNVLVETRNSPTGRHVHEQYSRFVHSHKRKFAAFNAVTQEAGLPDKSDYEKITKYLYAARRNDKTAIPSGLSPQSIKYIKAIRKVLYDVRKHQNDLNLPVQDKEGLREGKFSPEYFPDQLSRDVIYRWKTDPKSPTAQKERQDWINYLTESKTYKDKYKFRAKEEAEKLVDGVIDAMLKNEGNFDLNAEEFKALRQAEGLGLPYSIVEKDPVVAITRYLRRAATDLAWWQHIQSLPTMRRALKLKSLPSKNEQSTLTKEAYLKDGTPIEDISRIEAITTLKRIRSNNAQDVYSSRVAAANKAISSMMLGTGTGVRDIANLAAHLAQYATLKDLTGLYKMFDLSQAARQKAYRSGSASKIGYGELISGRMYDNSHPDMFIRRATQLSDAARSLQGREGLESLGRMLTHNFGEMHIMNQIEAARGGSITARKELRDLALEISFPVTELWTKKRNPTQDDLNSMTFAFVERVQGSYDERNLGAGMLIGNAAPFMSISRWSFEKFGRVAKDLKRMPVKTFLATAIGAAVTGGAIEKINELFSNSRGFDATMEEVFEFGDTDDKIFKLVGLLQLGAFMGIGSDLLKVAAKGVLRKEGATFNPVFFPLYSFLTEYLTPYTDSFVREVSDGIQNKDVDHVFNTTLEYLWAIPSSTIQGLRYLDRNFVNDERTREKELRRDLRVFRELTDRIEPQSRAVAKPTLPSRKERFKDDPTMERYRSLIAEAVEKANGNPETLKDLLSNIFRDNNTLGPSIKSSPLEFFEYLTFVEKTKGPDAVQEFLQDYIEASNKSETMSALNPLGA